MFVQIHHCVVALIFEHRRYGHIRRGHGEAAGGDAGCRVGDIVVDGDGLSRARFRVGIGQLRQHLAAVRDCGEGDLHAFLGAVEGRSHVAAGDVAFHGDRVERPRQDQLVARDCGFLIVVQCAAVVLAGGRVLQGTAVGHLHGEVLCAVAAGLDVIRVRRQAHGEAAAVIA